VDSRLTLRTGLTLALVSALGLAGCSAAADSGAMSKSMAPAEVVAERQKFMKANGATWKDIQDKVKAGNITAVAADAEALAVRSKEIPKLFPQGTLTEKSAAKPEIWQKWPEFEKAAMNMGVQAEKLRDAARANDTAQVQAMMKDFGKNACGTCHQPFRVPPKQQ
jgi:cytochrome c556